MLPVAILAGGLATRLYPKTQTLPKSLLQVAGEPFICRQLDYLYGQGVRRVVLCIGHMGEMIQSTLGDGFRPGLDVSYSSDGPVLLGTGGALKQALPLLGEHFFVLYGDSFLPIDFASVERAFFEHQNPALMTVFENSDHWDKSNVLFKAGRLLQYDKWRPTAEMNHIDYGLCILSSRLLEDYGACASFDLADVYRDLSLQGRLTGFEVHERFYEIGSHRGLQETEAFFLKRKTL